jgi:phosphoenolpyruvate carboxykinase (GTP)
VYQARDWAHGVLVGASVASETTAAATGQVGVVRRDPMAMQPFCGYNYADYWQHWLNVGAKLKNPPKIFHVNWFRRDEQGKFLWPGYGDNLRVLAWMLERVAGTAGATDTAIGALPRPQDLNVKGLDIAPAALNELLRVDPAQWRSEVGEFRKYLAQYGSRVPAALTQNLDVVEKALT